MKFHIQIFKKSPEKIPDADIRHMMIGFAVARIMELEVGTHTGAGTWRWFPRRGASARSTSIPQSIDPGVAPRKSSRQ